MITRFDLHLGEHGYNDRGSKQPPHQVQDRPFGRSTCRQDCNYRSVHQQALRPCLQRTPQPTQATIGIDFLVKNITIDGRNYRLQLWDTAGQERFKSLIPSYLKDASCCLLVYDVGNAQSLESAAQWLKLYNQHKNERAISVVVGNKIDLPEK
jgi:GTPase SAR1 family protein